MKKRIYNNKGFTLVELIVVLVILALLAAILVPALLGYIDEAKSKEDILNAKACMTAIQSELAKEYAKGTSVFKETTGNDVFLHKDNKTFCNNIINKLSLDSKPNLIMFYSYLNTSTADPHKCYTVYSVVYQKNEDSTPVYFDYSTNTWELGSPYDKIFKRGNGNNNTLKDGINNIKANEKIRYYVVCSKYTDGNIIKLINDDLDKFKK